MNHLIPVFMGSKGDMPVVKKAFGVLDSFGIPYKTEIISGEKYTSGLHFEESDPKGCLDRLKGYDRSNCKIAYLAIVGMANTMGPLMSGNTHNPVVSLPKGNRNDFMLDMDEIERDMWSSLIRASDAPMLTVLGDGRTAALYMAEIIGTGDVETRRKVYERKGLHHRGYEVPLISLVYEDEHGGVAEKITKKIKDLDSYVAVKRSSFSEEINSLKGVYPTNGPIIMVSELSDPKVYGLAENSSSPIIVTLPYGINEVSRLRNDGESFLNSLDLELPVGLALSPGNAALAALRVEGLGDEQVSERLKAYSKEIRENYKE